MASTINRLAGAALAPEIVVPVAHGYNPGRMIADDPLAADAQAVHGLLHFGPFELDLQQRTLTAGGTPVRLDGKTFDLLEMLVLHCGETLTKADIIRTVWRGRAVSDKNVDVQMSALRRALAAQCDTPFIVTLPDQRYRFVADARPGAVPTPAPVSLNPPMPTPPEVRRKPGRSAGVFGAAVAACVVLIVGYLAWGGYDAPRAVSPFVSPPFASALSIVVLPFRNLSADTSDAYLADAVTDDLNTELQRIPGSIVIARETAEFYQARHASAGEAGQTLHVAYVLEGSAQPAEGMLHINAKLIDAATQSYVWQSSFDVPRAGVGAARDLIVGRIAASLDFQLVRAETARSLRDHGNDPGAMDRFYRARSILDHEDTLVEYETAEHLLDQAVADDPGFAEAWAELGWMLISKVADIDDQEEDRDVLKARSAVARALSISGRNPLALSAQGRLQALAGDYAGAISSAQAALSDAPNNADAQLTLATALFYLGRLDDAAAPLRASLRIDPEGPKSTLNYFRLGNIALLQKNYPDAIRLLRTASATDIAPDPGMGRWGRQEKCRLMLIAAYQLNGAPSQAKVLYTDYARSWPHRTWWRVAAFAPKTLSEQPGFGIFLKALGEAGMQEYADEREDDHVKPSISKLEGEYFAPTPVGIPSAKVIDTAGMMALMARPGPRLVIDVGTGTAAIESARWKGGEDRAVSDDQFVRSAVTPFRNQFPGAPVVIMADGTYGVSSYNAALALASSGAAAVFWYRGGEEAWAKARQPAKYLRMD